MHTYVHWGAAISGCCNFKKKKKKKKFNGLWKPERSRGSLVKTRSAGELFLLLGLHTYKRKDTPMLTTGGAVAVSCPFSIQYVDSTYQCIRRCSAQLAANTVMFSWLKQSFPHQATASAIKASVTYIEVVGNPSELRPRCSGPVLKSEWVAKTHFGFALVIEK